jgi:hypothetical protein
MKKIINLVIILLVLNGCSSENIIINSCNETNTTFNQLYNNIASTIGYSNFNSGGYGEVHSYDFEVTTSKNICKIGYQSQTLINNTPYIIEIYNNTTNTIIYSESHIFSDTSTSYVPITPLTLNVGELYSIRRIQSNWNSDIQNKTGRIVCNSVGSFNFPLIMGDLKVSNPKFYDLNGIEQGSFALPYIDIVFEN